MYGVRDAAQERSPVGAVTAPLLVTYGGRTLSPFPRWINVALLGLVLTGFVGGNLWLITERHRARQIAQAACAQTIKAEVARKPMLANTVATADDCRTLRRMRGED